MSDSTDLKQRLADAKVRDQLVRIYRSGLEDGWASGYVVGLGLEFFALEIVDQSIRYDGYNCLRYADVSECKVPDPHAEFQERALKARGMSRKSAFLIDLTSIHSLLTTAGRAFDVITLHKELLDDGTCYIGKFQSLSDGEVMLREVTPDGEWDSILTPHPPSAITRVDFGCAYEEALVLVAGKQY